ncbi:MAG: hypothetical protein B6I24_07400 [Bacteroidetes bacterium 4572_128]|nr:MAG: hypothetical protein B6I24_07400 [Bacteroidetes bacterium 4572_128]
MKRNNQNLNCCKNFKSKFTKEQQKYIIEKDDKIIPFRENRSQFIIQNPKQTIICKIHVDGKLITDNAIKKCDFAFIFCKNNTFYFLELKGKDVKKAYEEIENTINY